MYKLELASEIPGTIIRAFWHETYGRLYYSKDILNAFNYTGKLDSSQIRYMVGSMQNPSLSLIDLERVNVRLALSDYEKAKSHIFLTAKGFCRLVGHSVSPGVVLLRQAIIARVPWETFSTTMINHGHSRLSDESKARLISEKEFINKQLPEVRPMLQLLC